MKSERDNWVTDGLCAVATGRFAPSPTGPMHMGHLVTALSSYCSVKQKTGTWLIRIDDIDSDRASTESANLIIETLRIHGMIPDREVTYQSVQKTKYLYRIKQLGSQTFSCSCSRRETSAQATYVGTCYQNREYREGHSIRLRSRKAIISFKSTSNTGDENNLTEDVDDFILQRKNGDIAYHLASAIDDGEQMTEVVRGDDLLTSTGYQLFLMRKLGLSTPNYRHIPCLRFETGEKLSSQNMAPALANDRPETNLRNALWYLGAIPPTDIQSVSGIIKWSIGNLSLSQLPEILVPFQNYDVTDRHPRTKTIKPSV
ncbi:MAG: tRNA glutamyl-Q(34) synthetase GluQRS [Pseudomonadota bacterium]|nr:tRNA glutamyl-Q(34) synthetase GluQRS [Pseudomonadota bacterium]